MKKLALIIVCIIVSCMFLGCKHDAIQFYRESKVSEMMKDLQNNQNHTSVKKSSGIVIYKDESNTPSNTPSLNFGPRDIEFDMPIKFK
ncbi:hypothetical protein IJ670_00820 [bacterium]|nr:hypothetical protein [bacterium]MBR1616671.1 hypothetical protein [bacterium]